jgi:hypothetical protein
VLIEEDEQVITNALNNIFSDQLRRNPFHWQHEGIQAREKMLECLADLGAVAHVVVHHPTGRRKQERAREAAFRLMLPKLDGDGVTDLLIESRSFHQDRRDRQAMVEFNRSRGDRSITYAWESKRRSELWMPDAVCGAVSNFLDGSDGHWYEILLSSGVIDEPCYINNAN